MVDSNPKAINNSPTYQSDVDCTCRSVKQFTDEYKKKGYPLHVLLNNAAIQSPKGKRGAKTEEGFEVPAVPCDAKLLWVEIFVCCTEHLQLQMECTS